LVKWKHGLVRNGKLLPHYFIQLVTLRLQAVAAEHLVVAAVVA
jgi:hypothetical protein